jgi:imidazolonepropionase-like amidohydrolase
VPPSSTGFGAYIAIFCAGKLFNQNSEFIMLTILQNAHIVDVETGTLLPDRSIVIENGTIREIATAKEKAAGAEVIDLAGQIVIPGLIDCHCHVLQSTSNLALLSVESPLYAAAKAFEIMGGMLRRGFTTVRDVGGADFGIARAVEHGLVEGPRVMYCGKALTATGGHGDYRSAGQHYDDPSYWIPRISRLCEGVPELRKAVRDEVRKGAHHIKIMANGGVASPTDRITSDQYSEEEIRAVVDEAEMAGLYVSSHTYTARSIQRAVRNGVHSVEHGNLADRETLELMKERGAYLVPTLIVFKALAEDGVADGLPADLVGKLGDMAESGMGVVEEAHRLGIPMAYGSDLIGSLHRRQSEEFELRADLVPAADLLRSVTIVGARLIRMESKLGQVKPGFAADLVAVRGNPLENIRLLANPQQNFGMIMKSGRVVGERAAA